MPVLTSLVKWINIKRLHQIDLFRNYPNEVQEEIFIRLITKAAYTSWGQKYRYDKIQSVEDFQKSVPLQTYDDIKTYVNRLRAGEKNLLWPGEVKWFAKSSGTTSDKSKFIPVTREALEQCHFRGGKDVLAIYTDNYPNTRIFSGKGLTLGGSHQINNFNNNSLYGDLSAILIQNIPFWAEFLRVPESKIALLDQWDIKLKEVTRATIKENVTNLAGVPSWNLVLINYILEYTGKKHLLEVWPNLELFVHGGVNFEPYRKQFEKLIPSPDMHYMDTYNASEGFFGIQDDPSHDDMLLMLDYGIFYEFIPMQEFNKTHPDVLTIRDVNTTDNYALVLSTNGGLWRYIIGDTIRFTSLRPHRFRITGRTRHFLNAFGEEVIIENAEKALATACRETGAQISEYTAAPVYMSDTEQARHEWCIEFETEPADIDTFVSLLDKSLMDVNSDYEAKRYKDITLAPPLVHKVLKGTFYNWFNDHKKLGGQNKMPRLSNDRKYLEEILQIHNRLQKNK
ncbi:MAG: GH3 auxin-responsive promoter family protein [Chlorobi bacterium]|nr:GH3 auxin-responsive promoter family protein [Chlorobiota bacterium]